MNNNIKRFLLVIIIIGVITFIVTNYFIQVTFIQGESMLPTYKSGDIVLIKKNFNKVSREDIIIGKKNGITFIKRVVGVPDDKLIIVDGKLYINDKLYKNIDDIKESGSLENLLVLKDNEYFVLGDNINNSKDSRSEEIGIINKKDIIGIVIK